MKLVRLIYISSIVCLFSACYGMNSEDQSSFTQTVLKQDIEFSTFDFETIKNEILIPQCIKCHSNFINEDVIKRYLKPGLPDDSILYQLVKSGEMPAESSALSMVEVEAIRKYILSLKPQIEIPAPIEAKYSSLRKHLFEKSCLQCHSGDQAKGNIKLDSYDSVIENLTDIKDVLRTSSMPPRNSNIEIPDQEIKSKFFEWTKDGAQNN